MVTANNVPIAPIQRISTGIDVLDWMWGSSDYGGLVEWGFPVGAITLMPGESGLGKTRICVAVARALLRTNSHATVTYFQDESPVSTVAALFNEPDARIASRLDLCDESSMADQVRLIDAARPTLVIIDSITMIDEFGDGTNGKQVKALVKAYRDVAQRTNAHIVFLSHVTKNGKTKGNTMLPHLVDTIFLAHRVKDYQEGFVVDTGKHRFGLSGLRSYWKYEGPLPTGHPSEAMFQDRLWTRDHSMAKYPRPEKPFDAEAYVQSEEFRQFCKRVNNFDDPSQGCWLRRKATQLFVALVARR